MDKELLHMLLLLSLMNRQLLLTFRGIFVFGQLCKPPSTLTTQQIMDEPSDVPHN